MINVWDAFTAMSFSRPTASNSRLKYVPRKNKKKTYWDLLQRVSVESSLRKINLFTLTLFVDFFVISLCFFTIAIKFPFLFYTETDIIFRRAYILSHTFMNPIVLLRMLVVTNILFCFINGCKEQKEMKRHFLTK